jgi:hypothetical protein
VSRDVGEVSYGFAHFAFANVRDPNATIQNNRLQIPRLLRAIINWGNKGPNLWGCRGMGTEVGAGFLGENRPQLLYWS